ncbi:hypothetical protein F5883DRAFT_516814 [Diaporthe sp. PMI_573]|nr:hypothetical protein F5883DRAFT_516814 [Diaporthaceae sp. PMI_573]
MGVHDPDVDTTPLWEEAWEKFEAASPKALPKYLKPRDTPKLVTNYFCDQKRQAVRKSVRFGTVLERAERLELIVGIGDIAMKTAPESIGLVWAGSGLVFKVEPPPRH